MSLTVLIFSGALIYWLGLITHQRPASATGFAALLLTLLLMLNNGAVESSAIPLLIAAGLLAVALKRYPATFWRFTGWTVFIALVLALGMRLLPFFTPVKTLQTAEHLYRLAPEKIVLFLLLPALVLVPWSVSKSTGQTRRPWLKVLLVLAGTLAVVIPVALLSGFVRPGLAPQSAAYLTYWLAYNLIFTCILEESLFRGILQTALIRGFSRMLRTPVAQAAGIAAAALLFGLAHIGGGLTFVVLATIAGVGYGLAYELSGRLHYAVLVHFAVNAVRMLAFSGN